MLGTKPVGVESDGYGGVAQHLGDYREVNVAEEEQGGAGGGRVWAVHHHV